MGGKKRKKKLSPIEKVVKQETEHLILNWEYFGYDEKPSKRQAREDVLANLYNVMKLYREGDAVPK